MVNGPFLGWNPNFRSLFDELEVVMWQLWHQTTSQIILWWRYLKFVQICLGSLVCEIMEVARWFDMSFGSLVGGVWSSKRWRLNPSRSYGWKAPLTKPSMKGTFLEAPGCRYVFIVTCGTLGSFLPPMTGNLRDWMLLEFPNHPAPKRLSSNGLDQPPGASTLPTWRSLKSEWSPRIQQKHN